MNSKIFEDMRLAFKTNDPDLDNDLDVDFDNNLDSVESLGEFDLDEIVAVVKDYMKNKTPDTDNFNMDSDTDLDFGDDNIEPELSDNDYDEFSDDGDLDAESNDVESDNFDNFDNFDDEDLDSQLDHTEDFDDLDSSDDFEIEQDDVSVEDDPDFAGNIRTVKGAALVFKRATEDGTFEELWVYNIGKDIKGETQTRRAILAGTDIDPSINQSEDGKQKAEVSSAGNVQFLHIMGLPN